MEEIIPRNQIIPAVLSKVEIFLENMASNMANHPLDVATTDI
jgi:hypothetical protein